ncbi:hypothetical protein LCGC14_0424470 [marine sediment metagenome]|uniref:Phage portal protein n=1 Tax=marine sediment metagenome TaxID=412755 RepID=A0A0F9SPS7_9ZZZZ
MLDKVFGVRKTHPSRLQHAHLVPLRSTAGIHLNEHTALSFSAVWAAVKLISETVALLPWRVFREEGTQKELQAGTQLDVLLHSEPNPEMTSFSFREFIVASALLHGNGYAEIELSRSGEPRALHPIHPRHVQPMRNAQKKLFYRVRSDNGDSVDLPPRQMFHLKGPTIDGVVGRSVISIAKESMGLGIAAEQFSAAFFGNGGTPSYVIKQGNESPDTSLEAASNILESFDRRHRGAKNAGKAAYLEKGFELETVGIPQKDAQFIQQRKFNVTEIARWFRVPPHKIADMEKATFSNIESQERNFVMDSILPWTIRLEQEANHKLVRDLHNITKMNVRGLMRGDSAARGAFYTQLRDLGVFSPNEIRALEDMNPFAGGDLRVIPANMISLERAAQGGGSDPAGAVRGVLLEAHDRMITKEDRASQRAIDSGKDLCAWSQDFYSRHEPQMCDALMIPASTAGDLVGVDADIVRGIVETHVRLHCELSMSAMVSGGWKANGQAAQQTDRLMGRLIGASNV